MRPPLPGGPYLVVGLARSGRAAALALRSRGEQVIAIDAEMVRDGEQLAAAGVELAAPDADHQLLLERVRTLVKSPGVPRETPLVAAALARAMTVIGELELAWRMLPGELVAVTGTNGKTTTVELLGAIHAAAGRPFVLAGNVGRALSAFVGAQPLDPASTLICEVSSFQLEDALELAPRAAALLNVSPDHLDRHRSFERYRQAKLRLFKAQRPDDVAVAPESLIDELPGAAHRIAFGAGGRCELRLAAGALSWRGEHLIDASELRLRGAHNLDNAMAASAVALARGIGADAVRAALRSFAGLPHRLEQVAERNGVRYVNDSKATNVASAIAALAAFEVGTVHLILGGRCKDQAFAELRAAAAAASVRGVYLIGEDAQAIARALDGLPLRACRTLERAVSEAGAAARPGDVVLLSPACASYDQFRDFEQRGEAFRALVG